MNGCVHLTHCVISISLIIISGLMSVNCNNLPCYFFDSINITDGTNQSSGSILFDGIVFPQHQHTIIDYFVDDGERKPTSPYRRGCLCNIKSCFRLCCSNKLIKESTKELEENCNEELTQMEGEVFDEMNIFVNLVLGEQTMYLKNRTCKPFYIQREIHKKIINAGTFRQNKTSTVRGYCQKRINDESYQNDMDVSICIDWVDEMQENNDTKQFLDQLEHISMILSVPFLILTLFVYIFLPELHKNLHGKCFVCYLICQASCFILEIFSFNDIFDWEPVIIYLFLCAFQWLNVSAFDAWWNLRNMRSINKPNKSSNRRRFILYMFYAIFSPFLLNILQMFSDILKSNKVDPDKVDELEVAGFICMTFTINIIFFILTALKILQVKNEINKLTSQEHSSRYQKNVNVERGNFRMYLRLFIVMGLTYSISGISYLITRHSIFSEWTEIILSLQGVWIFILFVLKRRVFSLIQKRWEGTGGSSVKNSSQGDLGIQLQST